MNVYDVFISYRRSDGLIIAEALYEYLSTKGLRVFLDRSEMVDGHYFTTQLEDKVRITPNYILIGTADVFQFRTTEKDWVFEEIAIATAEYEKNDKERTVTVLTPSTAAFPEKDKLPKAVCNIADAQRIFLPSEEDYREAFYRVLKAVTQVNRRNLWQAAHRWLEESKRPGGRFASLHISQSILPNAIVQQNTTMEMPILVYDEKNAKRSLLEAIGSTNHHHYLIGEGGIGKTTALMHIMNSEYAGKHYSPNGQIPIFVELSFAPDTYGALYEGGKSSFIRRAIFKQLRSDRSIKQISAREVSDIDEVFATVPYDVAVKPITDVLSRTTPAPEYLLLLDGLNEVSSVTIEETGLTVVQMVVQEIDLLLAECPNVRVILTSRSDEVNISDALISRLHLTGIEDHIIEEYLGNSGISKDRIVKVLNDENLRESLRIPLFLTMYASLSQSEGISTQGEILKTFLSERRKNVSVYTAQERLVAVEKNVSYAASMVQMKRINADMQSFILDFLLPEIAWHMERKGEFYLRIRDVRKIIAPVLTDTSDAAVCGEFGREIFAKYRKGASAKQHTYKIAQEICKRFSETDDMGEVAENVVECCIFSLGIMQESNSKYGFIHQHIRDYFAAVKNINALRLAVYLLEEGEKESALECMNGTFKEEPVGYSVRRFMGEHLCEHKNKPYFSNGKWNCGVPTENCERTLIEGALSVYRNILEKAAGYGLYSLLKILQESRNALAGIDLSNLDLSSCSLNGTGMGIRGLAAKLNGAKINKESMFPAGHTSGIMDVQFSGDGTKILSAGRDGTVKIWNVKTDNLITNLQHEGPVLAARFLNGDKRVISVCTNDDSPWENKKNYVCCWELETEKLVCKTETLAYAERFAVSKDEQYILIASSYSLQVLSTTDFLVICELFTQEDKSLVDVNFVGDGSQIAILLQTERSREKDIETSIEIWDVEERRKERDAIVPGDGVAIASAQEGKLSVFVQSQKNGESKELTFEANTLQQQTEFTCYSGCAEEETNNQSWEMIQYVKYSKNGLWYAIPFYHQVNLYSAKTNSLVHSFTVDRCCTVDFDATGSLVVFGTFRGEIRTYSVSSFSPISIIDGSVSDIYSFAFSPDNRYVATMGGRLELWDASSLKLVNKKNVHRGAINQMAFSSSGNMIHNWPGVPGLVCVPELQTVAEFKEAVRFDRVGAYYATIKNDENQLQSVIYDLKHLRLVCTLNDMLLVAFSDDKAVVLCNKKMREFVKVYSSIAIVDIPSGEIVQNLNVDKDFIASVIVSKKYIAALSQKGMVCVWDAIRYLPLKQMHSVLSDQNLYTYKRIAFSNDGKYLFEYVREKTIVRDPESLKEIIALKGEFIQCTSKYLVVMSMPDQEKKRYILIYSLDTFSLMYSHSVYESTFAKFAIGMSFAHISSNETQILLREGENAVGVYHFLDANHIDAQRAIARIGEIKSEHGMDFYQVDLNGVHPDKPFTDDEKKTLQRYGAIIV